MSDTDLYAIIKALLLAMNGLQESVSAVAKVLKDQNVMTRKQYEDALAWVAERDKEKRERIQKLGSRDPMLEFLKEYHGPIQ